MTALRSASGQPWPHEAGMREITRRRTSLAVVTVEAGVGHLLKKVAKAKAILRRVISSLPV